jgi:hypothetical protein
MCLSHILYSDGQIIENFYKSDSHAPVCKIQKGKPSRVGITAATTSAVAEPHARAKASNSMQGGQLHQLEHMQEQRRFQKTIIQRSPTTSGTAAATGMPAATEAPKTI